MKKEKWYDYWLCSAEGVGNRTISRLIEKFGSAREVYQASEAELLQVVSKTQFQSLSEKKRRGSAEEEYQRLAEQGIAFYTVEEPDYPGRLKEIPDPPYGLFVRGRMPREERAAVAVVGARDCSEYGRYVAGELGRHLGRSGIQVISGMARGIDGISQEAALDAGGTSFGVLGCGVDVCYPAQNKKLYERLLEQGGILSSYLPGTLPKSGHFPPRNRIVSGLADVLVVIEARRKSGTLITVDMALEQGKDVYVVPGRVTDRLSDGCNNLLKQGAGVFLSPEEFVSEIQKNGMEVQNSDLGLSGKDQLPKPLLRICEALDFYPLPVEEIAMRMGGDCTVKEIHMGLMQLCLEEMAVQVSPGYFCRRG